MNSNLRSADFATRSANRYWWFKNNKQFFVPPVFGFLSDEEWDVMTAWYDATDAAQSAGEANMPAISLIHGLVMGSRLRNIVQLGHYEGFSTLLIGFMLRKMGYTNSFCTIDIDAKVSATTEHWVKKAGLQDYVKIITSDSSAPEMPAAARDYFGGDISLVFIDSSHAYDHTVAELDLWYPAIKRLGLILLHDVSGYAINFDYTKKGGVHKALLDWAGKNKAPFFTMNGSIPQDFKGGADELVYGDVCGIGLIQKPY